MTQAIANPVTTCVGCGQVDDHPKHVTVVNDGQHTDVRWHHDCHAAANPPCSVCASIMEAGAAGKTGEDLRAHIVAGGADHASTDAVLAASGVQDAVPTSTLGGE
jgi:hypothetical protein